MLDKNGKEIKTGDVVRISGAYFKNDNALYFVEHSPGDTSWEGREYCLHKISKRGKISTAKYNLCFWPIAVFSNSYETRAKADDWNEKNAQIEIVEGVENSEVIQHFIEKADEAAETAKQYEWRYGEGFPEIKTHLAIKDHYKKVVARLTA